MKIVKSLSLVLLFGSLISLNAMDTASGKTEAVMFSQAPEDYDRELAQALVDFSLIDEQQNLADESKKKKTKKVTFVKPGDLSETARFAEITSAPREDFDDRVTPQIVSRRECRIRLLGYSLHMCEICSSFFTTWKDLKKHRIAVHILKR